MLWPYGSVAAASFTVVWVLTLAIVVSLTTELLGWPSPQMRVPVIVGLVFYGLIPPVLILLDRIFVMLYGPSEHSVVEVQNGARSGC